MNLRTIIIFALLVCACILPLHAQVGEQRHNFAVGVNGGINLNSVSFSPSVKQKNLMGINGGVTARYISEKYFSMICGAQIELNFSQHGWDEYYEDYPTLSYTRTMNYVEIPFLAHLAFGKDRGLQFFIHAGLYGFRVKTLMEIISLPQSSLEKAESLEQLRWLQNGYRITAAITDEASRSIDTPEDLKAINSQT